MGTILGVLIQIAIIGMIIYLIVSKAANAAKRKVTRLTTGQVPEKPAPIPRTTKEREFVDSVLAAISKNVFQFQSITILKEMKGCPSGGVTIDGGSGSPIIYSFYDHGYKEVSLQAMELLAAAITRKYQGTMYQAVRSHDYVDNRNELLGYRVLGLEASAQEREKRQREIEEYQKKLRMKRV